MKNILRHLTFISLLLVVGCREKYETFAPEFVASSEAILADENADSKVMLYHDEEWTRWEVGDIVRIFALNGSDAVMSNAGSSEFDFHEGAEDNKGFFRLRTGEEGINAAASTYSGIFPSSCAVTSNAKQIQLAKEVPYRPRTDEYGDYSFGAAMLPMVAYHPGGGRMDSLRFHMLAGIMRLQFFGATALGGYTVKDITLTSVGGANAVENTSHAYALSGTFDIKRFRNNNPYLADRLVISSHDDASVKYTLTDDDSRVVGGTNGKLWTFYIPLPALGDNDVITGTDRITHYRLRMTLHLKNNNNGQDYYFHKGILVDIHRQNITMMPAIQLGNLTTSPAWPGTTAGNGIVSIVGNGTKDRPFRIYTGAELDLVRQAFLMATPAINGQTITENTCFEVVRSDIRLMGSAEAYNALPAEEKKGAVVWTEGIRNFIGHMEFKSASTTLGGIISNSPHPLFESINDEGTVERMQIRGNITYNGAASAFSPLCGDNHGKMLDCHVKCAVNSTSSRNLAGLCVNNYGTIEGGANEASLTTGGDVCGCVWNNFGTVQGSFSLSSAVPEGTNIAGICMHNYGLMQYCQVASNVDPNSTGNWGVIAFYNHRDTNVGETSYDYGIVDRCISSGSVVFSTTGSIGGIVHTNDGIVKNCSNEVTLRGASGAIGGIVSVMRGGEVYNCDAEGNHWIDGAGGSTVGVIATYAGGVVGHLKGGAVRNSYNHCRVDGALYSGGIAGSFDEGAVIENCWSAYGHNFIGDNHFSGRIIKHCFCGHMADFSYTIDYTTFAGCNIVDTSIYTVYPTLNVNVYHVLAGKNHFSQAEINAIGTTPYIGRSLNYWVDSVKNASNSSIPLDKANGGAYCSWLPVSPSATSANPLPTLNFSSGTGGTKSFRYTFSHSRHRSNVDVTSPRRTSDSFSPSVKQRFKHSR